MKIANTRDVLVDPLENLQSRLESHLLAICRMFKQTPKITLVIRTPWLEAEGKDGGVLLSDDDFDLVIAEINRLRNRKPVGEPS